MLGVLPAYGLGNIEYFGRSDVDFGDATSGHVVARTLMELATVSCWR